MGSDGEVDKLAPVVADEEKDVQGLEEESLNREEVAGPDHRRVILEEGTPRLRRRPPTCQIDIPPDGLAADVEPQVEELTSDVLSAPEPVLPGHPADEVTQLLAYARTAGPTAAALPGPVTLPGLAVPSDYRFGLDDDES
jgi:hypothetical protein